MDLDRAKCSSMSKLPRDKNGELYGWRSVIYAREHDLDHLGVGALFLNRLFILLLAYSVFLAVLFGLPGMIINYALPERFGDDWAYSEILKFSLVTHDYADSPDASLKEAYWILCCVAVFSYFFLDRGIRVHLQQFANILSAKTITPAHFTVVVSNVPEQWKENDVHNILEKFGEIVSIRMLYSLSNILTLRNKLGIRLRYLARVQQERSLRDRLAGLLSSCACESKEDQCDLESPLESSHGPDCVENKKPWKKRQIELAKSGAKEALNALVAELQVNRTFTGTCLVTFNRSDDASAAVRGFVGRSTAGAIAAFIGRWCCPSRLTKRTVLVSPAPEPHDIRWNQFSTKYLSYLAKIGFINRVLGLVICAMVVGLIFYGVEAERDSDSDDDTPFYLERPSYGACQQLFLYVYMVILHLAMIVEGHPTRTTHELYVMKWKMYFLEWLQIGQLFVFLSLESSTSDFFGVYGDYLLSSIVSLMISTVFVTILLQTFLYCLPDRFLLMFPRVAIDLLPVTCNGARVRYYAVHAIDQDELETKVEPKSFPWGETFSGLFSVMIGVVLLMPLFPFLALGLPVFFFLALLLFRYQLLMCSNTESLAIDIKFFITFLDAIFKSYHWMFAVVLGSMLWGFYFILFLGLLLFFRVVHDLFPASGEVSKLQQKFMCCCCDWVALQCFKLGDGVVDVDVKQNTTYRESLDLPTMASAGDYDNIYSDHDLTDVKRLVSEASQRLNSTTFESVGSSILKATTSLYRLNSMREGSLSHRPGVAPDAAALETVRRMSHPVELEMRLQPA